jgi:EAL domain-containing protein (putative c-di-GMP-specific phosphodiesterase class I)/GGDEF domain-containing protein
MRRFTRLRTKLTLIYAGVFAGGLLLMAAAVYSAIADNARRVTGDELRTGGAVYDRVLALKSDQLQDGADVLVRDFGFRTAVATRDEATIRSALDNLKSRLDIDRAFLVDTNGTIHGDDGTAIAGGPAALWRALDAEDNASGVLMIGKQPYQAISAPILTPERTGWVVFAVKLDDRELSSLERLSAVPLDAAILEKGPDGRWVSTGRHGRGVGTAEVSRFIDTALAKGGRTSGDLDLVGGRAIALVKPLRSLSGAPSVLLLRFSMAKALAPYRPLLALIAVLGAAGLGLFGMGSWALARSITRPLSALDDAAQRLQRGEDVSVRVHSHDEIGRLAHSFNTMAAEIREREQKITHLAYHDSETDLPNRLSMERAIAALDPAADRLLVVAALGVNRFQFVRGAIGHRLASTLIARLGGKLAELYPAWPRARLSTDVLGLAFEADSLADAERIADRLLEALEHPIRLAEDMVDVSLSAGLAIRGADDKVVTSVIERADIALDQARASRRKVARFDEALYGDPAANLSLTSEMAHAIARGDMVIHHQPKYDLRAGAITGAEALVRWRHPTRGMVAPDLFITLAEETGHIRALTECVLAKTIADQAMLRAEGHDIAISVNISGRLMSDPDFADAAIAMIERADAKLAFEITETAVIDNPDVALGLIQRFAAAGVGVAIDDYGAGLSSLTYLKQIPADELKIDKSFVLSLADNQRDRLLVKSTIDLAHSLGLKVTAEGVETSTTAALLAAMGCDHAQGYLIARPMCAEDLGRLLKDAEAVRRTVAADANQTKAARRAI